jgi:hypothetical protein
LIPYHGDKGRAGRLAVAAWLILCHREVMEMKLRYFVVDAGGQLQRASQAAIRGLWDGRLTTVALGCPAGNELRLVSVVCDEDLQPRKLFLLRLPLASGLFDLQSRLTLELFSCPDCVTPGELARHHTQGWPADFFVQLAVALDVPVARLGVPLGVGGPLFLAAKLHVTPQEALRHLR